MTSFPVIPKPVFTPIHVESFGKDHWSLLAYVESVCVDGPGSIGVVMKSRLRGNQHKHPMLAVNANSVPWRSNYSTRLAGFFDFPEHTDIDKAVAVGVQVLDHDDWDCLDDLQAAGYVEILSLANGFVRMLPLGQLVAAMVRDYKARGGQFAQFRLPSETSEIPQTAAIH